LRRCATSSLFAIRLEAKILVEERHYVILKSIRDGAGVRAGIDLKTICNSVLIEDVVQLDGIEAQAVLIAHIHGDGAILL
jgi:hypothetical protein